MGTEVMGFEAALAALFDPAKSPLLKIGTVDAEHKATAEQLEAARHRLYERRQHNRWKLIPKRDANRLAPLLAATLGETENDRDAEEQAPTWTLEDIEKHLHERILAGHGAILDLPFYPQGKHIHIEAGSEHPFLNGPQRFISTRRHNNIYRLTPSSHAFRVPRDEQGITLRREYIEDYLVLYSAHIFGSEGPFLIVEEDAEQARTFPASLTISAIDLREGEKLDKAVSSAHRAKDIAQNDNHIVSFPQATVGWPVTVVSGEETGPWTAMTSVIYGNALFRCLMQVEPNGEVAMLEDNPVPGVALSPIIVPWGNVPGVYDTEDSQ